MTWSIGSAQFSQVSPVYEMDGVPEGLAREAFKLAKNAATWN